MQLPDCLTAILNGDFMRKFIAILFTFTLAASNACLANEGDDQASSFTRIYTSTCLQNLTDLEALRQKLKPIPTLPPEKAAYFLTGLPGDAWPVPDKYGTFVLALPSGKNLCAVNGRRANTEKVIELFTQLVTNPPAPLTSKLVKNEQMQTEANGLIQTVAYEWSIPGAARKLLFMLTTAPSDSASLQVLATASIIK